MKNSLHLILCVSFLVFSASAVSAQESGSPSFESYDTEDLREREGILSRPGGGGSKDGERTVAQPQNTTPPTAQPPKDSANGKAPLRSTNKPVPPPVPKDESKPDNQSDDSILSFNFLYYLIQKYKMQDILE